MTPSEARAAMVVVHEDELTATERRLALEFFSGPNAGNKVQSYLAIYPKATYGTASMAADKVLNSPRVKRFLNTLQQQVMDEVVGELRPWIDLLPLAQSILVGTAQGKLRSRLAYEAACYLVNRCLGQPTASVDVRVQDSERVAAATKNFTSRMAEAQRRRIPA